MESYEINRVAGSKKISDLLKTADMKLYINKKDLYQSYLFGIEVSKKSNDQNIIELFIEPDEDEINCPLLLVFFGSESDILDRIKNI